MNKERTLQLKEKELLEEQERQYREQFDAYMESELERANANQAEMDRARSEALVKQRLVLEEQIHEKQEAQRLAQVQTSPNPFRLILFICHVSCQETCRPLMQTDTGLSINITEKEAAFPGGDSIEFEKEKELVDAIARKIEEEDVKELIERRDKQRKTKQFIDEFNEGQERLRLERREAEREEERRIEEYAAYKRQIEQEEEDRKNARREEADRKYHKLKLEMEAEMRRMEEEDRLINLMREEEQAEKARAAAVAKREREERMRAEMMAANEEMKAIRVQRQEEERQEEERFRQMLLAKFAEDERIEQMNAQRRRMKQQEHKREVERLIHEKRRMYEEFKANELLAFQAERAEDDRKAAIVEEQRRRLLREAAELGLADYLPKGVIREDDDLQVFGIQKTKPTLASLASSRGL
eukprot:scaffold243264_cov45-Prasinocladus_malaysianus.AAC.5